MSSDIVEQNDKHKGDVSKAGDFVNEPWKYINRFPPIYDGGQFLFIDVPPGEPFEISFHERTGNKDNGSCKGADSITVFEPVILSKYQFNHLQLRAKQSESSGKEEKTKLQSTDELLHIDRENRGVSLFNNWVFNYTGSIDSIITDKKIYKLDEEIRAAVFAPSLSGKTAYLTVRHNTPNAEALYEDIVKLNHNGAGFSTFSGMGAGEYVLLLKGKDDGFSTGEFDKTSFSVAEYSLSLLNVKTLKHKMDDGKFFLEAFVSMLNSPYSGQSSVLICDDKTGLEDIGKKVLVKDGLLCVDIDLPPGPMNPFHVKIITEDGGTAEIHFPNKSIGVKNRFPLGKLGNHFTGSVYQVPSGRDLGWFNGTFSSRGSFPLELLDIHAKRAVFHSTSSLKMAQIVLINPLNGSYQVFNYNDVEKGRRLSFDIDFPYSIIHAAAWGETPVESWGVVFRKSETGLLMETPETVEPGKKMKVKLESSKPVTCLLTVTDSRIEREDPLKKAGAKLYTTIAGYGKLLSGEVIKIEERKLIEHNLSEYFKGIKDVNCLYQLSKLIPERFARLFTVFPISVNDDTLVLAMKDTHNTEAIQYIKKHTGKNIIPVKVEEYILLRNIIRAYPAKVTDKPRRRLRLLMRKIRKSERSAGKDVPELSGLVRSEFPEVIHFEIIELDGSAERIIRAGEQSGVWKCCAYAIDGFDFSGIEREIPSIKSCFVEIDAPSAMGEGDKIEAGVRFDTGSEEKSGILKLKTPDETIIKEVSGKGVLEFYISSPGDIIAEIESGDKADKIKKSVQCLNKGIITISRVQILHEGGTITGDNVEIYPSLSLMINDFIKSLLSYPYGCAEQTSSKLFALSVAYRYAVSRRISIKPEDIKKLIIPGLNRLAMFFHSPGLFSMWRTSPPLLSVTAKVLENLIIFKSLSFNLANKYLLEGARKLRKMGFKSNRLVPLGKEFRSDKNTLKDLVGICRFEKDRKKISEAVDGIKALMITDNTGMYWKGRYPDYWAGKIEATCDALSVLWEAGEKDLCFKCLKPILSRLREGRLYSTSDMVALIWLLYVMDLDCTDKIEVKGEVKDFSHSRSNDSSTAKTAYFFSEPETFEFTGKQWVKGQVRALDGELMTRTVENVEVDYLDVDTNFPFSLELSTRVPKFSLRAKSDYLKLPLIEKVTPAGESIQSKARDISAEESSKPGSFRLSPGEKASLTITPLESTLCPLCHILLPGNVALMKSGGNVQQISIPIENINEDQDINNNRLSGNTTFEVRFDNTEFFSKNNSGFGYSPPLTVEIAAVRKGRGRVFVVLSDMYDSEKKGVNKGIEIVVQ